MRLGHNISIACDAYHTFAASVCCLSQSLILSLEIRTVDTKLREYPSPPTRLSTAQSVVIAAVLLSAVGVYSAWAKPPKDPATPLYIIDTAPPHIQTTLNEYKIFVVQPPPTSTQPLREEPPGSCDGMDPDCLRMMRGHRLTREQQEAMHQQTQERWCREWGYCREW